MSLFVVSHHQREVNRSQVYKKTLHNPKRPRKACHPAHRCQPHEPEGMRKDPTGTSGCTSVSSCVVSIESKQDVIENDGLNFGRFYLHQVTEDTLHMASQPNSTALLTQDGRTDLRTT